MNSYDPYLALANAVVLQAVKDYRKAEEPDEIKELERFFFSQQFGVFTGLDPAMLVRRLRCEKIREEG